MKFLLLHSTLEKNKKRNKKKNIDKQGLLFELFFPVSTLLREMNEFKQKGSKILMKKKRNEKKRKKNRIEMNETYYR